ncbi:MAG: asparagine synthase (glutamine-hydrolyzing) [Candidatus Rokuibacteriota bacterium]
MCGIVGFADRRGAPAPAGMLKAMTDVLSHRGPDGEGYHLGDGIGMGHRRLAIIDLSTGAQPMANQDGSIWITYNGEIYNFKELRGELEARGFTFRTTSDTEVILHAYEADGVECLKKLRGMFAFGIWDGRRRRLFLARDRAGIKPLVYAWDGDRLLFASELKAILQDPSVPREVDWEAFRDYLTFHYIPSPKTIFRGIRKLPAGSYLVLDLDRGEPKIGRYWDLRFVPDQSRSETEWIEGLRWHLEDAVRSHLVSDVPIGAFLSGGMDSSTVVALMAQSGRGPVRTFSIGFDEGDFNELAYARRVAGRYGTDHYEFVVKPDALEAWPRLAWQFDEPFADSSALPTYYVAKITREHVTVALSGDGGDENFAGYLRYARALTLHQRLDHLPGLLARPLLRLAARLLPPGARGQGYAAALGSDRIERYFRMMTFERSETLRRLLTPEIQTLVAPEVTPAPFRRLAQESGTPDYVSTLQYLDFRTYLPDDILTKVDRTSMLVSLESRVPLLDHLLLEYVATMPTPLKLRNGAGKAILKRAMSNELPREVLERRKMGFGVPLERWFRRELSDYIRDVLLDGRTRERGWMESTVVAQLLEEHRSARKDHSSQIWALLCLEEWARRWLDR